MPFPPSSISCCCLICSSPSTSRQTPVTSFARHQYVHFCQKGENFRLFLEMLFPFHQNQKARIVIRILLTYCIQQLKAVPGLFCPLQVFHSVGALCVCGVQLGCVLGHLEPVVRPAPELHLTVLVVEGKPGDVYLTGGHEDAGRDVCAESFTCHNHICWVGPVECLTCTEIGKPLVFLNKLLGSPVSNVTDFACANSTIQSPGTLSLKLKLREGIRGTNLLLFGHYQNRLDPPTLFSWTLKREFF